MSSCATVHSSKSASTSLGPLRGRQEVKRRVASSRRGRAARPRPGFGLGADRDLVAGQLAAELGGLQQRQAALAPAADVERGAAPSAPGRRAARRSARPGRRHAAGRAPACPCRRSRCRSAAAEVVASSQWVKTPWSTLPICHGPAITPQRSIVARRLEGVGVLGEQQLGGELRRAVEGARAGEREVLGDPVLAAPASGCSASSSKRVSASRRRSSARRDGIDAAGREEDNCAPSRRASSRQLYAPSRFVCTT